MKLHKFIQRICAATVASALTLSLCTPVRAEGIAALPAPTSGTSQPDETGDVPIDPAHFPDENFRKYLGQKAIDDDKTGILSQTEREKVTAIVLHSAGNISDLTGIKYFPNLKELYCNGGDLANLDVSQNTKLTNLYCYNNQLTSLDGVSGLQMLTRLSVNHNTLTDVSPLAVCTTLTELDISNNTLTDISALSTLVNLERFVFSSNQVTALPEWPEGCKLQVIDGAYNAVTSLDNLSKMGSLTYIYMDYNQISNIDSLADCYCLVQVNVFGNPVSDVAALREHDIIVNYDPT